MTAKKQLPAKINPLTSELLKRKAAVKKIDKERSALQDQMDERGLARETAIKSLHNKELENLGDGPEYFQARYAQEYDLLQDAKKDMDDLKSRFGAAKKRKQMIIERICNLKDEIEESKSPIIKLSKTLDDAGWKKGETNILSTFGLPDSLIVMLESEGYKTIGDIMDDDSWQDISGMGDASTEKVLAATAGMIENFNERLAELKAMKAEKEAEAGE